APNLPMRTIPAAKTVDRAAKADRPATLYSIDGCSAAAQPARAVRPALHQTVPPGLSGSAAVPDPGPRRARLDPLFDQADHRHGALLARSGQSGAPRPRGPRDPLRCTGGGTVRARLGHVVLLVPHPLTDAGAHQGGGVRLRTAALPGVLREHALRQDRAPR